MASQISNAAFERGLLVETCGPTAEVVKLMPPLTVAINDIDQALDIIEASVKSVLAGRTGQNVSSQARSIARSQELIPPPDPR
jgi:acetylornithine/succinyldiaminopimelate/putrescine aminotransferase